jgi:hypothetical protein
MTLHALIIGLNTYDNSILIDGQYAFGALQGCVRDAQALHDWLQLDQSYTLNAKLLLDKDATKDNIVAAFHDHLSLAKPGDAILIFYSGHGTVEHADATAWPEESDGRLEGLACYYEQGDTGKFILADKELRYLLHSISKPDVHIVTLFDCCHSGDNTRTAVEAELVKKQGLVVFQQRQWNDFVFADKFKREDFIGKNLADLLPEGQYIQLAASESNEPAIEALINRDRHGVFAYFMLEILRENGGHITYRDLCNRIRNRIRYKYGQRIKIYAPPAVAKLEDAGFLKKSVPNSGTGYGTVDYNLENNEYRINRGILDRLASRKTTVTVTDTDGSVYQGIIGRSDLNTAEVVFEGTTLSKLSKKAMAATLEGLASRPLRICLVNKDLPEAEAEALSTVLFSTENESFVQLESDEIRADYTLLCWAGMYYITKPGDWYRPIVMPVFMEDENVAKNLLAQLQHIAQWHFMLDLRNDTDTKIPTDFLQVEVTDSKGNPLTIKDGVLDVPLTHNGTVDGAPDYSAAIHVQMKNNGPQDLYVQPVLMMDYGCMVTIISNPDSARPIEKGGSEALTFNINGEKTSLIPMGIDDTVRLFNHEGSTSTLKFIISLAPINGSAKLDLEALPLPHELVDIRDTTRGDSAKGGFAITPRTQTLPDDGWNAFNLEVRNNNPLYDTPDWKEVKKYMAPETGNSYLAHFFTGLYLEPQVGPSVKLAIRTDFDGLEKGGFFSDAILTGANYWANFRRNYRYKKMAKQYPDLPKMVSEGDSWFQHPLLDDIIDNIANNYPTYCLAAAGDTIRNYFSKGEVIQAVREIKPAILILSGGGNDILGDSMPNFLNEFTDSLEEGQQPGRFFNPTFTAELDDICDIYRNLFEHFKTERPDMPILIHSYDYPHPRATGAGPKSNWLGQYLDQKKITRAVDRSSAVKYMLDEFNARLKKVADAYPGQVYYLDLRNLVRDNQWDDEIHPNNNGFQNVSGQFLRKISELLR